MQNLKNTVLKSAELLNTIGEIAEDGRFNWLTETLQLMAHVRDIGLIAKAMPSLEKELLNLTPEGLANITNAVIDKLDFSDEVAEVVAENILQWVVVMAKTTMSIVDAVRAKK